VISFALMKLIPAAPRLEAQGLVTRSRSAADERVLDIALSDKGRALRASALSVPQQIVERTGLGIEQLAALRDGLAPFTDAS